MGKPRIAFFIDKWHPGSGTENQLQGLLSHMAPDHIDAHLFTLREPIPPEYRNLFPCQIDCFGIESLRSWDAIVKFPAIVSQLRQGHFDAAMIYFVDSNLYFVPACRLAGIPSVVINRRDMGYWYNSGPLRQLNIINQWATDFLVNAEAVKEQVIENEWISRDRIHVITNGMWDYGQAGKMEISHFRKPPKGFPVNGPVVGITASLREVKRIDRFLEMASTVVKSVPNTKFVIAGQGHLLGEMQELAKDLSIEKSVVFLGQVRDIPELLGHLEVAVLSSESEGLSNSLVEYGLAGVASVAFSVGGNAEVICEGLTGYLVSPGDSVAMAERVIQLLSDPGMLRKMSQAAKVHCEITYSPERVGGLYLDYFKSLIDRNPKE